MKIILKGILVFEIIIFIILTCRNIISLQCNESEIDSGISEQEIKVFNAQFEEYCGLSKSAGQVITVFSVVVASNASESRSGEDRYVNFSNNSSIPNNVALTSAPTLTSPEQLEVNNSKTYDITADYGTNGFIVNIRYIEHISESDKY